MLGKVFLIEKNFKIEFSARIIMKNKGDHYPFYGCLLFCHNGIIKSDRNKKS